MGRSSLYIIVIKISWPCPCFFQVPRCSQTSVPRLTLGHGLYAFLHGQNLSEIPPTKTTMPRVGGWKIELLIFRMDIDRIPSFDGECPVSHVLEKRSMGSLGKPLSWEGEIFEMTCLILYMEKKVKMSPESDMLSIKIGHIWGLRSELLFLPKFRGVSISIAQKNDDTIYYSLYLNTNYTIYSLGWIIFIENSENDHSSWQVTE